VKHFSDAKHAKNDCNFAAKISHCAQGRPPESRIQTQQFSITAKMPSSSNTLLIEGSFTELSEELAQYLDSLSKTDADAGIQAEITPLLDTLREDEQSEEPSNPASLQKQKDDVLKKIVSKASILNGAPEKGTSNSSSFVAS